MEDSKFNMALDDVIKKNKKMGKGIDGTGKKTGRGGISGGPKRGGRAASSKNARVARRNKMQVNSPVRRGAGGSGRGRGMGRVNARRLSNRNSIARINPARGRKQTLARSLVKRALAGRGAKVALVYTNGSGRGKRISLPNSYLQRIQGSNQNSPRVNARRGRRGVSRGSMGRNSRGQNSRNRAAVLSSASIRSRLGWQNQNGGNQRVRGRSGARGSAMASRLGFRGKGAAKGRGQIGQMQSDIVAREVSRAMRIQREEAVLRRAAARDAAFNRARPQLGMSPSGGRTGRGGGRRGGPMGLVSGTRQRQQHGRLNDVRSPRRGGRPVRPQQTLNLSVAVPQSLMRNLGGPSSVNRGSPARKSFSSNNTGTTLNERFGGGGSGRIQLKSSQSRQIYF